MGSRLAIDRPEDHLAEWRGYYEGLSLGVLHRARTPAVTTTNEGLGVAVFSAEVLGAGIRC
jgi:hypothetical protein